MNRDACGMGLAFAVAIVTNAACAQFPTNRTEPRLVDRSDVLLVCDFENDDWWTAWGSRRRPVNTVLVGGDKAHGSNGGASRSPRRAVNTPERASPTSFASGSALSRTKSISVTT